MQQHRVWPQDSWHYNVSLPSSLGVRAGDTIYIGGQTSLSSNGLVRKPNDLFGQADLSMDEMKRVLGAYGATLDDLVKLVVWYVDTNAQAGQALVERVRGWFTGPNLPVLTMIPMPHLAIPGLVVQIEGYACRTPDDKPMARAISPVDAHWSWGAATDFPHGIRVGEMIYLGQQFAADASGVIQAPGDIVGQSVCAMENAGKVLRSFGADFNDVVKFNIYYSGTGGTVEWERSAVVRAQYFKEPGPAATGIPIPRLHHAGALIQMEVMAMLGTDGKRLPREHSWPEGHWDWPVHLPYKHGLKCSNRIFIGGQVPLDGHGKAVAVGDIVLQTQISVTFIRRVLEKFGATLDDVCKVNAFYVGDGQQDTFMRSARTYLSQFSSPGPCSTGVPVPALAMEGMDTEIEVVAVT